MIKDGDYLRLKLDNLEIEKVDKNLVFHSRILRRLPWKAIF